MDNSRPTTSSRPMSRTIYEGNLHEGGNMQSTRVGTASRLSALPANRLSTSKNIGILQKGLSDRPLTQQGLSGITTSYGRIGTGTMGSSMRQVKDKRYWMSLIQTKLQEILQETEKLKKEKKNLDRETSAQKLYEKKVKEQAKELSTLHSKLSEMNLALDSTGGGGSTRQQLQNESIAFREKNEFMQNQLEQIFRDRQTKEQQNQALEEAIESEKRKVNELIYSLSADDQNKYREYQIISEKLKNENTEIHVKIEDAIKQKEKLSANIINSQSRMEAVKLQSKLRETVAKRDQLKDEEVNRLTPAQEREKLISEVRINNQSINSINKQMKITSDQLQEKREYLQQIEQDLDEGSSERFVKFKELKKRDEMMSSFMETFQIQLAKERQHVETLKNQITFAIEQITLQGINSKVDGSIKISTSILNENPQNLNTQQGLMKEYGKLQIQLKQLSILEKRLKKQTEELKQLEVTLIEDTKKFANTNSLRDEYAMKYEEVSSTLQELKDKKRVTESVVKDAEKRYSAVKDALRSNETYRQISHMEEKLSDLLKDNKALQVSVDDLNKEFDFSETKRNAQEKVEIYNQLLCEDLRNSSQNKY